MIHGDVASAGIAIGTAFWFRKNTYRLSGVVIEDDQGKISEVRRFKEAVDEAINEIGFLKNENGSNMSSAEMDILDVQVELLKDPQIIGQIEDKINQENKTAGDAVIEIIAKTIDLFLNLDNEYLKGRIADIQDTGNRLLLHLGLSDAGCISYLPEEGQIVLADELSPVDTVLLIKRKISGFATVSGAKTSHSSLIAKSKQIPAVVGCGDDLKNIKTGDIVVLDAFGGVIFYNPETSLLDSYAERKAYSDNETESLKLLRGRPAITIDGIQIKLLANISEVCEVENMQNNGGDGIGLLRTELLFMNSKECPSENEQYEVYRQIAVNAGDKPVTIRTFDIGGDKKFQFFDFTDEANPFLGYRAIRIGLKNKDFLLTQIRAVLRASVYGRLRIMFPMISNIREIMEAKKMMSEAKNELSVKGISFDNEIKTGIMVEVPSAALMADSLAKEVDFFSIGTNDLCQYTLAVDRMNEKVRDIYDYFDPSVLRLIRNVIDQAHKNSISVSLCGEMASDPMASVLLTGMGIDELSMSPASIPAIKRVIMNTSFKEAQNITEHVMNMNNSEEIKEYLKDIKR